MYAQVLFTGYSKTISAKSIGSGFDRVLIIGLISKSNTEQNTKNEIQFKAEVQSPTKKQ